MAGVTGLEPAASGVTGRRSNQTELHPRIREAVMYSTTPRVSSGAGILRTAFFTPRGPGASRGSPRLSDPAFAGARQAAWDSTWPLSHGKLKGKETRPAGPRLTALRRPLRGYGRSD